jgi:hypothetical protein
MSEDHQPLGVFWACECTLQLNRFGWEGDNLLRRECVHYSTPSFTQPIKLGWKQRIPVIF